MSDQRGQGQEMLWAWTLKFQHGQKGLTWNCSCHLRQSPSCRLLSSGINANKGYVMYQVKDNCWLLGLRALLPFRFTSWQWEDGYRCSSPCVKRLQGVQGDKEGHYATKHPSPFSHEIIVRAMRQVQGLVIYGYNGGYTFLHPGCLADQLVPIFLPSGLSHASSARLWSVVVTMGVTPSFIQVVWLISLCQYLLQVRAMRQAQGEGAEEAAATEASAGEMLSELLG
eukprot:scaffold130267_cov16-Tisochrysis_lutea.AAC.1